jgi:hypothetical protein
MFYIGSEGLAEDYLHMWFTAFWYTVCGSALLSAGLAGFRLRVPRSHPRDNGIHTKRRRWLEVIALSLIPIGIAAAFAIIGALNLRTIARSP